jgi:hypothetical protein
VANEREIDIALASVSVQNGPEKPILYGAKGNLGAKKTFLILDSWGLMKSTYAPEKMAEMEHIDGIFCNDEFAASIVKEALPEYAPEDIHAYGTPGLEQLEVEKAAAYRQETREKLGIDPDAFTILYGGDVSADYTDLDVPADINVETFEKTRSAVAAFANAHPERKVAVVVRPHPRARGTKDFDVLIRPTEAESPVENVLYKNGSNPISINEASYAADVIVSIVSTENLFAPARGRRSIFLAYKGLGDEVLNDMYGVTASDAIEAVPGVKKVSSEEELVRVFEQMAAEPPLEPQKSEDATKEILNTMLAD